MRDQRPTGPPSRGRDGGFPPRRQMRPQGNAVDTGPNSPQIAFRAWKSPGWRDFANAFPFSVGGFLFLVGILVAGNSRDAQYAPIFFVIGLLLVLTWLPLRTMGKGEYRLGIDRGRNMLWVSRSGTGITGVEHDANRITGFSYVDKRSFSLNATWYLNPSMPFLWNKTEWLITVGRTTSAFQFGVAGSGLATEKEAREVAARANRLLGY